MAHNGNKRSASIRQKGPEDQDRARLRRFLFLWLPVIILALGFMYAFSFDPVKEGSKKESTGVILGDCHPSLRGGTVRTCTVKLNDGDTITLEVESTNIPKDQRGVLIKEKETLFFKRKIYDFVGFRD